MKTTGLGYPGGADRAENLDLLVTSYPGVWKMKVQLCAAQPMNCDGLMLDEPTGHLDVDNVKRLWDWLESFTGGITCTSHWSPFLDKMCPHIIDLQDRGLKTLSLAPHEGHANEHGRQRHCVAGQPCRGHRRQQRR